jgi:hypothetical protein
MSDKWERSLIVPAGPHDETALETAHGLIGYGIRAVFSHAVRQRSRSLPVTYLQSYRGFPRKCPELYCSASIRVEHDGGSFPFYGRGQALTCYDGHGFACFRFGRSMVLSKLDLYLARLGAAKWQKVIRFPGRSGYGRGLLRALWDAPYEGILCAAGCKRTRAVSGWHGWSRRFAGELHAADRTLIKSRMDTCLDLCSEDLRVASDHARAVEFTCSRGHRVLVSKSQRGTFLSSRLILSFSLAPVSL